MLKIKLLLLGVLAVFAMSAVVASSASAGTYKWLECSEGTASDQYPTQGDCEDLTGLGSGAWEWLEVLGERGILALGGTQTLKVPTAGAEIVCKHVHAEGDVYGTNTGKEGEDLILDIHYLECTVEKPSGCGYVSGSSGGTNGLILVQDLPTKLSLEGGVLYDLVEPNPTTGEIVTLYIETSQGSGTACGLLGLVNKVKGTAWGKVNNTTGELEFENKGTLKVKSFAAEYEGKTAQTFSNGDKILADG